jgi:hypothetical protein
MSVGVKYKEVEGEKCEKKIQGSLKLKLQNKCKKGKKPKRLC